MSNLDAGKALLMVESSLCRHLLCFKDLSVAPWAALPVPVLPRQDGGVRCHDVSARPVQLVAADVAVEVAVRANGSDVDADRTRALAAAHALLVVQPDYHHDYHHDRRHDHHHALLAVQPALDLHLLGRVDGAVATRTRDALVLAGDLARVGKDLGSLVLGEGLLEASLAVDLVVGALVHVVEVLEGSGALGAAEALGVPGKVLRQLSLHLECLPLVGGDITYVIRISI